MTDELEWTDWAPLAEIPSLAPRLPGVYEVRDAGGVIYVGLAGDRRGQGVAGRLRAYAVGKSPDSGLAGHASRRALADPRFCRAILAAAEQGRPWTVSRIAVEAARHLGLSARAAATPQAPIVERMLIQQHGAARLWNTR